MIARLRTLAVVAALFLICGATALAQEDSVLQRYDLAVENLEFAVNSVPGDAVQARDELERAVNALLTLSRDTTSATLVEAMERTFESARVAVDNQSHADLAVQAAVLRGGFRRLVADSAFTAGAAGDLGTAASRLEHIAVDMGFSEEALTALRSAGDSTSAMRLAFEAGAAEAIATDIVVAERLISSDRSGAYESLAAAYGDSLLIQDSPRADPELNTTLLSAAQALVAGNDESFVDATDEAEAQLSRLASAARSGAPGTPGATSDAQGQQDSLPSAGSPADGGFPADAGAPATEPNIQDSPASAESSASAAAAPAGTPEPTAEEQAGPLETDIGSQIGGAPQTPQDQPVDDDALEARPGAALEGLPPLGDEASGPASQDGEVNERSLALALARLEQDQRDAELTALSDELVAAGLPAGLARTQGQSLLAAGFTSLGAAQDEVSASVNQAVAAMRLGDAVAAAEAVARARTAYAAVSGVVNARDAELSAETDALFTSLLDRPALREHDLTLLAAQVEAARVTTDATNDSGLAVERAVDSIWGGWPRLVVFFVLGLLAFVPLRYLNLAFGGGNANWRMVAWALFLLLVPLMYEALAALGSVLADLTDTPALDTLSRWSMFTSTTGQVAWAVVGLLAVLFATVGLRGISAQFGLLGGRGAAAGNSPTIVESSGVRQPSAVDWDEEF